MIKSTLLITICLSCICGSMLFGQDSEYMYQNENNGYQILKIEGLDIQLYQEVDFDPTRGLGITVFSLPKIWSDLEKQNIENSIAVFSILDVNVKNIEDLIDKEFSRIGDILRKKEELVNENDIIKYKIETEIQGLKYVSQNVFIYQPTTGYGYIIDYTATEGTYNINLSNFEKFLENMEFINPRIRMSISRPSEN